MEHAAVGTRALYACPAIETTHRVVRVDRGNPTPMRAPFEGPGLFALEIAMDELAYELASIRWSCGSGTMPRSIPHGRPFSSKKLRECYEEGARRFGWAHRDPKPGAMRDGRDLVGYGMATALHADLPPAAKARISIDRHGDVLIETGTQEIGTGLRTVFPQIAADGLACRRAGAPGIGRYGSAPRADDGGLLVDLERRLGGPGRGDEASRASSSSWPAGSARPCRYGDLLAALGVPVGRWRVGAAGRPNAFGEHKAWSMYSFGAVFAEVRVDEDIQDPAGHPRGRRLQRRQDHQPEDRSQPDDRRHHLGPRPGAARTLGHGPKLGRFLSKNLAGYLCR